MNNYNSTVTPLITPEEAANLFQEQPLEWCNVALDIASHYWGMVKNSVDELSGGLYIMGVILNAGRIQGIREERAKHKQWNRN